MPHGLTRSAAIAVLVAGGGVAAAQQPPPILDMHLHARTAAHYGPPPQHICAPVDRMPFWDPARPIATAFESVPCTALLTSPSTDEEVLRGTLAVMERHNVFGVLGGSPELVAAWMAAAPGRFLAGLDFRLDRPGGTATVAATAGPYRPPSPDELRALHGAGRLQVLAEVLPPTGRACRAR